ncbi:unnamed protein product [Cuscuta campestris]|uniref:Uncharacterized protein n=2 Tax=Cuscuta sect. Cleistogrammica TaxID=1824901 RepID=A0A484MWU0_9ASTE|nr:hypothetical protein DM860_008909 [Cuscuta australis]VFQ92897.1 unnamed protein product [Cuscuta campestris]
MLIHKILVLFLALSHLLSPLSATSRNVKEIMGGVGKARQADDEVLMKGYEQRGAAVLGRGEEEFGFIFEEGRGRMKIEINDYEGAGPNRKHEPDAPLSPGNGNGKGNR